MLPKWIKSSLEDVLKVGGSCKKAHKAKAEKLKTSAPGERMTKEYPSNLTWEQWELIADLFPEPKAGGRPRSVVLFSVLFEFLTKINSRVTIKEVSWFQYKAMPSCR